MARSRNKKTEIEEEIEKRIPTTRYNPDYKVGLTAQQVQEHRLHGWVNRAVDPPSKTTKEIVHENVFTYFNLIFLVLAILLCLVGSFRDLTFLPVIIANTLIGIIQEVRAKKVLDNLTMLNAPKATVVRDGKRSLIDAEELVVDDIVIFKAGAQVCADAQVCAGEVQVNESLLTGESDEITKHAGDQLMSGSFIISGQCHARLDKVGEDSYISKLTLEAKEMQNGEQSEMIRSLDKLVKCVGVAIIPIGIILVAQSLVFQNASFHSSITSMVAAVIGMIPEGLYLLASVALAVSSIRLAQQKVLLHDMKCIETLARVDVLCVDKTGTITENTMKVQELIPTEQYDTEKMGSLRLMVGDFVSAMTNDNITMAAMKEYFTHSSGAKAISKTGFSSATKYSSATFEDKTYVLGAPEFVLLDDYEQHKEKITELASTGARVLVFGTYAAEIDGKALTEPVTPLGYILLANPIREAAKETFQYFAEQGVEVKVISGDNPVTVSKVAKTAGIKNAENYVDASSLETEEDIKKSVDELEEAIHNAQIMMLPGGFSAGDEPEGSGKFIATVLRNPRLKAAIDDLLDNREGLMIGICNGFQALVKLGLLPHGHIKDMSKDDPTLTFNTIGRHLSQMVTTRVSSVKSPWLANVELGDEHIIPISHGEGRFVAPKEVLDQLIDNGQVAFQYVDPNGNVTMDSPYNPNGSMYGIEGIVSEDGRVLGKMGHSERQGENRDLNIYGEMDQKLFEAGVKYFKGE